MKKLTSLLLTLLLTFNFAAVEAVAIDSIQQKEVIKQEENAIIPSKLEKEIKTSLAKVYGQDNVEVMYSNILEIAKKAKEQRSLSL